MTSYVRDIAIIGVIFSIICSTVHADIAPWKPCFDARSDAPSNCTVHELRVTPCKDAVENKPCSLKRGLNATIEFDYTVNFESPTLNGSAWWTNQVLDLPFVGMESNACLNTPCPTTRDVKQTYSMDLPISKKYPVRTYDVKWKLKAPTGQECCFIFQIKIHK